ncbi:MAG: DUF6602 domain-containing protein [Candidatus Acidiferrales bacterium]
MPIDKNNQRYSAAWSQFLVARRGMLAEYDRALAHSKELTVSTHHGVVGEAAVRDWLGTFLPKRYGVVSGYIKAQGLPRGHQSQHFDVIIYDQLDSPTLWIEENKDKSESGRARIIPAEFVRAVLEVKSSFCKRTVREACEKLNELEPLIAGTDAESEKYPKYLPASAILAMVFFELRCADEFDLDALTLIRDFLPRRLFYGAVILRGEGLHPDDTGLIQQYGSDEPLPASPGCATNSLLYGLTMTATAPLGQRYIGAMLRWGDVEFSGFAFDLLALLNGTYRPGYGSSFHGLQIPDAKDRH